MTLKNRLVKLEDQEAARRAAINREWGCVGESASKFMTDDDIDTIWSAYGPQGRSLREELRSLRDWVEENLGPQETDPALDSWLENLNTGRDLPYRAPPNTKSQLQQDLEAWRDFDARSGCPHKNAVRWYIAQWKFILACARVIGEEQE